MNLNRIENQIEKTESKSYRKIESKTPVWIQVVQSLFVICAEMFEKVARAELIWASTTPRARRGHFAMGVGLEAGLTIDAMAEDLATLMDRADLASLSGDEDELADALAGLAERLLVIRPFIPDKRNALPATWRTLLKQWVSGIDVNILGTDNMRVVEDAFTYCLVWGPRSDTHAPHESRLVSRNYRGRGHVRQAGGDSSVRSR